MCGRFVAASDPDGLVRFFVVDDRIAEDPAPSWNVAPTADVLAVVEHEQRRLLVTFRWGLVPSWAPDPKVGSRMINARAETLADKPAYREAFARRRCLVAADGFYEWERTTDGRRLPHLITAADGQPLAFAGLWSTWRPAPDAPALRTCTIVTTRANDDVTDLHDRMPVVLPPQHWDLWLDRRKRDPTRLRALLVPAEAGALTRRRASPAVNDVRNDSPDLISAVTG